MVWGSQNYAFTGTQDELIFSENIPNVKLQRFSSEKGGTVQNLENTPEDDSSKKGAKVVEEDDSVPTFKASRSIIIEPSMVLAFMIHVSNYSLIGQYIYFAIGEKYNLTAIMADEANNNATGGDGGTGCGGIEPNKNSTAYVLQQKTQAEAARFNLYIDIVTDVPGFVVILFFGRLMDQMGRKITLVMPLVGLTLRALLYILQQKANLPLEMLLLGGVVEFITGGYTTYMTAGYAVLIDTVSKQDRARRLAILDISIVFAMAIMSFLMGMMIQHLGFFWPFVVIGGAHTLNVLYVIFFVPETGKKTVKCDAISPRYILDSFKVVLRKREGGNRRLLFIMVAAWMVLGFGFAVYALDSLYKLNYPFCWTPQQLGTFMAATSLVPAFLQMIFAHFFLQKLNDISVILFSLVFMTGSAIITGLATNNVMLWIAPLVGAPSGLNQSLMRSAISKLLPPTEQGSVFAFLMAMQKITGVMASMMYSNVYSATLFVFKGTVYMMMAGFMMITFCLLVAFKILSAKQKRIDAATTNIDEIPEDKQEKTSL